MKRADAGDGNTRTSGLESLRRFLLARRNAFADLSDLDDDARSASGYLNRHNGHIDFLIENDRFVDVVGGKQEADLIKTSLAQRGLLQGTGQSRQGAVCGPSEDRNQASLGGGDRRQCAR